MLKNQYTRISWTATGTSVSTGSPTVSGFAYAIGGNGFGGASGTGGTFGSNVPTTASSGGGSSPTARPAHPTTDTSTI